MRQIIDGKLYNTETAELLHEWTNAHYVTDFRYRAKDLYRTPKGALFLHHQGNAMTDVAKQHGDGMGPGEEIEPIGLEDALRFLESHDGAEVILEHFADEVEEA